MKKKILLVYDSMMTGGTTTALLSLMNTVNQNEYEISLLLYTNSGPHINEIPKFVHVLPQAYKDSKIMSSGKRKVIRTVLNGQFLKAIVSFLKYRKTPKGNLRNILMHYGMKAQVSLSRNIKDRYDFAIGFMEGWSNQYVASKKINANKKYVWIHPQYKSCYLIPEIDRQIFKRVNGIALVSENCRGQFFEFFSEFKDKTMVVPNITSPRLLIEKAGRETALIKKAKINLCTVCRCDISVKGLDRLLKVFCDLKAQGLCNDVLWHFVGGGTDFARFQSEVERLDMEDKVILYGNQLNPLPYLLQMDAFILASRYEGKPMSVTEAQILGLPCLVTNYESAYSQVEHEYNGLIMDNNYDSIYKSIKKVIQEPSLLNKWRENMLSINYGNEQDIDKFYKLLRLDNVCFKEHSCNSEIMPIE